MSPRRRRRRTTRRRVAPARRVLAGRRKRRGGYDGGRWGENDHLPRVRRRPFNEKGIAITRVAGAKGAQNGAIVWRRVRSPLEDILGISGEQPSSKRMKSSEPQLSPSLGLPGSVDVQHGRVDLGALFKK